MGANQTREMTTPSKSKNRTKVMDRMIRRGIMHSVDATLKTSPVENSEIDLSSLTSSAAQDLPDLPIEDRRIMLDTESSTSLVAEKPVIYLLWREPHENVKVTVRLSRHWNFSAVYPMVDTVRNIRDNTASVTWNVVTDGSDNILDEEGQKYSYLFWEATAEHKKEICYYLTHDYEDDEPPFACGTPETPLSIEPFVVLSFPDFVSHLDYTLPRLGLTAAMKTDFMTTWLPKFLSIRNRGQDIAFKFIPQENMDREAELIVEPKPSLIQRVFLLFGGVDTTSANEWTYWYSRRNSLDGANETHWAGLYGFGYFGGVDDKNLRVIEWGAMEVPEKLLKR
ncbi:hypothetical protein NKR23_g3397 [Pleurostoma richardsiae]|uniref:Uncharacterized protein n=1 Tax=Pleurostoma richardsiae TaxID=41990 RepID=A0AA38S7J4_9PEZI|nr:hypothetical protein NKR23_g3397 [Pleurostoma richardsiae]